MRTFRCKKFDVLTSDDVFKVGTDATLLGSVIRVENQVENALEIGSGSGIISLMMAQRYGDIVIDAIDSESEAVALSKINFQNSPFKDRLKALHINIVDYDPGKKYDVIYSNPPYHTEDTLGSSDMLRSAKSESAMPISFLAKSVDHLLSNRGAFHVIGPVKYVDELTLSLKGYGIVSSSVVKIRHHKDSKVSRVITEYNRHEKAVDSSELILYKEGRIFSDQATALLKDFLIVL